MQLNDYNAKPSDPQTILDTVSALANQGLHDSAMVFAEIGLSLCPSGEMRIRFLELASISGFYSGLERRKSIGKSACEELATDRLVGWTTRNLARQNSTYYAKSSQSLMPGTRFKEIGFAPPNGYKAMNPSIARCPKGNIWVNQRTVNYIIRPDGSYDMQGDSAIRTTNYLLGLDHDLNVISQEEILPPEGLPNPRYNLVIGWEDCRLFFWKGDPWCTATARELNDDGYCEIVLSRIENLGNGQRRFSDHKVITPSFVSRQHEKNWMPMIKGEQLCFLYSSDPVRIINSDGDLVSQSVSHMASDSFRGGGSLIPFEDGWLALIHESHVMPDWRRRYMHRWAWYDSLGRLCRVSESFYLKELGIEFAAGLETHPGTGEVIASFGMHDKTSWLAVFDPNDIKKLLRPAGIPMQRLPVDGMTIDWIDGQTNSVLKDHASVIKSQSILRNAMLPVHADGPKNWDNLVATWQTVFTTERCHPIMDVAATKESAYLPGLRRLGYQDLSSINLDEPNPRVQDGIRYLRGDCTATEFPNDHFGFVSCLSVLEHGVDITAFFSEMNRILKPGGHVLVSTDYWSDPVDAQGQVAFGSPVRVFSADDIQTMIHIADALGLKITGDVDLSCKDRVVNWIGMDYTFISLLFRKS